jgi:precorrin-2 dehydrogenase/sirohydrochlorin ferrochelatase/precorrin-6A/cobalt-precorrin-6A reductase
MKHFPIFVDLNGRKVLVAGGGNIAERRIKILKNFGAKITVISPKANEYIEQASSQGSLRLIKRGYMEEDISKMMPFLVIAATDNRKINHDIMTEAKKLNILASAADCSEECTFYFPAIAENDGYIAGLVSKSGNHGGLKEIAEKVRKLFNP